VTASLERAMQKPKRVITLISLLADLSDLEVL